MRHVITVLFLSALAVAADGPPRREPSALLERAMNRLQAANAIVARSRKIVKESKRIRALVQAKPYYRGARALTAVALRDRRRIDATVLLQLEGVDRLATHALVEILNSEAEFHFGRTSTGKAKRLNDEALTLLPRNGRALQLARDIRNAANSGVSASRG